MTTKTSWEKGADDTDDDGFDDLVAADGTSTMMVEDAGAFDCSICYLPFKPPIFQCMEGHAVCSTCREKLMAAGNTRCYMCWCCVDLGYIRSHSLERMVESVRAHGTSTMMVDDAGAFDCSVCFLPFKPPICQCMEGHAVCSTCREKLMSTGYTRCHVCRINLLGYMRSHSLERMVESVRVPCPYAAYGCAARPVYHDRSAHRRTCLYRCPVGPLRQFYPWRRR